MKHFFKEIIMAISDFKFYKPAKDFPLSKSMRYIFSLILLITIALSTRYSYDLKRGIDIAVDWARQSLPPIVIQDGIVKADIKQPYKIKENDFIVIVDTTGEITSLDGYKRGILVMKDRVMYKESELKTETYNLSNIKEVKIDENFMNALKRNAIWVLFPIMFIFIYIGLSIARFLQILIFSLISVAASSITGTKLSYKQLFNIGIFAITPSTILGALLAIFGVQLPLFGIIYSGLYIIYLIMAILASKEAATNENIT